MRGCGQYFQVTCEQQVHDAVCDYPKRDGARHRDHNIDGMSQRHDRGTRVESAASCIAPNGAAKRLPSCSLGSGTTATSCGAARSLNVTRFSAWPITDS